MSKDNSKITTIWLSPELRQRARALGINISAVAREALQEKVTELEAEIGRLLDRVAAGDLDALNEIAKDLSHKEKTMLLTGVTEQQYEESIKPHKYEVTNPYKGCARCGFGPGAAQHNIEGDDDAGTI